MNLYANDVICYIRNKRSNLSVIWNFCLSSALMIYRSLRSKWLDSCFCLKIRCVVHWFRYWTGSLISILNNHISHRHLIFDDFRFAWWGWFCVMHKAGLKSICCGQLETGGWSFLVWKLSAIFPRLCHWVYHKFVLFFVFLFLLLSYLFSMFSIPRKSVFSPKNCSQFKVFYLILK